MMSPASLNPFLPSSMLLQENTVVQTCVVACYSLASSGGFGCYLLSMDQQTYTNLGNIGGNRPEVSPLPLTVQPSRDLDCLEHAHSVVFSAIGLHGPCCHGDLHLRASNFPS